MTSLPRRRGKQKRQSRTHHEDPGRQSRNQSSEYFSQRRKGRKVGKNGRKLL